MGKETTEGGSDWKTFSKSLNERALAEQQDLDENEWVAKRK